MAKHFEELEVEVLSRFLGISDDEMWVMSHQFYVFPRIYQKQTQWHFFPKLCECAGLRIEPLHCVQCTKYNSNFFQTEHIF